MKKIALYLFLASSTFLASCSDDDEPAMVNTSLLAGEWNLSEIKTENGRATVTVPTVPLPLSADFNISGKDYDTVLTFTESTTEGTPNTFSGSGGFTLIGTLSLPAGEPIVEEQTIPDLFGMGEWSLSGNTLTTIVQDQSIIYEITELTEQKLVLKTSLEGQEQTIQDFTGTVESGDQFATFTK